MTEIEEAKQELIEKIKRKVIETGGCPLSGFVMIDTPNGYKTAYCPASGQNTAKDKYVFVESLKALLYHLKDTEDRKPVCLIVAAEAYMTTATTLEEAEKARPSTDPNRKEVIVLDIQEEENTKTLCFEIIRTGSTERSKIKEIKLIEEIDEHYLNPKGKSMFANIFMRKAFSNKIDDI